MECLITEKWVRYWNLFLTLSLLLIFTVPIIFTISTGKSMNGNQYLLAQTILGEAEGENWSGKLAVANVIMNRLEDGRFGKNLKEVILKKYQFSCWNKGSPRIKVMENPKRYTDIDTWEQCRVVAKLVLERDVCDKTKGSLYYVHKNISKRPPKWLQEMDIVIAIDSHVFYRDPEK